VQRVRSETPSIHQSGSRSIARPHGFAGFTAATLNGLAVSSLELATWSVDPGGLILINGWPKWWAQGQNVTVTYKHGGTTDSTEIGALKRLTAHRVTRRKSGVPARAERNYTDANGNTVWLATEGPRHTGIPSVDAVLHRSLTGGIA
jgi:hypothetical protein